MSRRLLALAAGLMAVVLLVGWATAVQRDRYLSGIRAQETLAHVVAAYELSADDLMRADGLGVTLTAVPEGKLLIDPAPAASLSSVWGVHAVGMLAEVAGVLMSFWLARAAGMVPQRLKGQILGLSLILGVVSYSTAHATSVVGPVLTPQHLFASLKDGFVWAAAFPMFGRAFGLSGDDAALPVDDIALAMAPNGEADSR
jgi:hypothetical protein